MKLSLKLVLILIIILIFNCLNLNRISWGKDDLLKINKSQKCPQDLDNLSLLIVKNISDYANRIIQKSRPSLREENFLPLYIITASQPDLKPLKIEQNQYQNQKESHIKQIFFTTIERQYSSQNKIIEVQNYHWLLLTQTNQGWQMVMLLTQFGISDNNSIYSPPYDSTDGIIGQAVKIWLRDCQFNSI